MFDLAGSINSLRANGWTVAVHNDYHLKGELRTFWLFTNRRTGRFVKGEGSTDEWAIRDIMDQLAAQESSDSRTK